MHCTRVVDTVPWSQVRLSILILAVAALALSQSRTIRFSGEVKRGETFTRDIDPDLQFVLRPSPEYPNRPGGWTITVTPKGPRPAGCDDLVWVATPPYRSYNPRYLDLSYATTPTQAVAWTPRAFSFVLDCASYSAEERRVRILLWPASSSEAEVKDAQEKLGSSPLGRGRLFIRDARVTPPNGGNPGSIDWLRFDVELELP